MEVDKAKESIVHLSQYGPGGKDSLTWPIGIFCLIMILHSVKYVLLIIEMCTCCFLNVLKFVILNLITHLIYIFDAHKHLHIDVLHASVHVYLRLCI